MTKTHFLLLAAVGLIVAAAWHALKYEGRGEPTNHALPCARGRAALAAACRETAERVARDLGPQCRVIVQTPMVLAGELSDAELQRWWRETIEPAARAMAAAYFAVAPDEPVTILLFATEDSYRRHAKRLFGDRRVPRCGYYRPHLRTVLVNAAAGSGALLHELTHALAAFDFPDIPDWLGEGLASLHEQAVIGGAGQLIGQSGPRLAILKAAISTDRLPPLRSLLRADDFHGPDEKLLYAQARYFCLYMQRQGVLGDCYRHLRAGPGSDPRGEQAVRTVFPGRTWDDLDADFRRFLGEQTHQGALRAGCRGDACVGTRIASMHMTSVGMAPGYLSLNR